MPTNNLRSKRQPALNPSNRRSSQLKVQFTNIRGFRTNFNSLQAGVETDHPDMLAISESKLDVGVPSIPFNIPGYLNSAAAELNEWINVGIDVFIPSKKFQLKAHSQLWFTPACAAAIAHRNHDFNLHSSTKTDESHWLFKLARNCCKRVLDQAKLEYVEHVRNNISIQKLGTRDFSRTANSVLNNNKSAIPPLFQGPIVVSSPKDKADVFAHLVIPP